MNKTIRAKHREYPLSVCSLRETVYHSQLTFVAFEHDPR